MVVSNEPGYYEDGKFGIRIESVVLVKELTEKMGQWGGEEGKGFGAKGWFGLRESLCMSSISCSDDLTDDFLFTGVQSRRNW